MKSDHVAECLRTLTQDEKIRLLTGDDSMSTASVPSHGIKGVRMSDGSNGVKTGDGRNLCMMSTGLLASSWDREICRKIGKILGVQAAESGVDMLLAPAINLKRNPLAGRNFEYYSEDPVLTGLLASEYVKGIRSEGTLVCLKHFACNNQEYRRWTQNSVVDEDTMRNLYLKAFELVIKHAKADAVMASYNRVNGTYACENRHLLTDILRKEWKFDGVVMSDWCAINQCVASYQNGLDLEMPGNAHNTVPKIKAAMERGELTEAELDQKAGRILKMSFDAAEEKPKTHSRIDTDQLIRMTGESFVLLKNDKVLPLERSDRVLLIGNAKNPRIQGGGCAKMQTDIIKNPYEEMEKYAAVCDCIEGYELDGQEETAKNYDKILIFLSLPEDCDSEAFDRRDLLFPKEQTDLIKKIRQYNKNIITVLQNGSAVDLSFEPEVKGILETYYAGSYGACALAKVLYGDITPSGKLAETFPMAYADVPNRDCFGLAENVLYSEREFVGYRYYGTYGVKPRYPFGYGGSYCRFVLDEMKIERVGDYEFDLSCNVTNCSAEYDGKETVQIYLKSENPFEPRLQLLDFAAVRLGKGETKTCRIHLGREQFAYYAGGEKITRTGRYAICIATSSEDIQAEQKFLLEDRREDCLNENTLVGMLLSEDRYRGITLARMRRIMNYWAYGEFETEKDFETDVFLKNSIYNMPIRSFAYFAPQEFDDKDAERFLAELRGIASC